MNLSESKAKKKIKARIRAHEVFGKIKYRLILEGILVGFFTGSVVSIFRMALGYSDDIRNAVIDASREDAVFFVFGILMLALLTRVTYKMMKAEPMISGSGIPQVKGEIEGFFNQNWRKVLVCKVVGGFCAITGGLSLGREGPSIQLGAMVGKGLSKFSPKLENDRKTLMVCGAGAGLACAFSAPLAGVIFTIEELQKKYSAEVLICTMASCITADCVASYIFGLRPVFTLNVTNGLPISRYWEILILAIILGGFGAVYNKSINLAQNLFQKTGTKGKVIIPFVLIVVLAIWYPDVLGSGHDLVGFAGMGGHGVKALLILLVIKFVFSVLSFGTGAPGGIFLPLLVMGAITGGAFSELMGEMFSLSNDYISLFVILGMAGFFSAIVGAPITGIILISEMTGVFSNLLPLSIVSLTAFLVAEFNYTVPIYDQLLDRMLRLKGLKEEKEVHFRAR